MIRIFLISLLFATFSDAQNSTTTTTTVAKTSSTTPTTTTVRLNGLCANNNGDCSDNCDDTAGHVICSCKNKCWVIGADGKTCVPELKITCDKNIMSVNLPRCSVADVIGLVPYSDDPKSAPSECKFQVDDDNYNFSFDVTQCDSTTQTVGKNIKFGNAIKVLLDWSSETKTITREGDYVNINLVCSYSNHDNVTHSYWLETQQKKSLKVEGFGDFTFAFDFYKDNTFEDPFTTDDFPIAYHFNESIYYEISSASNIANVELFTKSCVATPDGDLTDSTISYNFMQEGCLVDPTLDEIANSDNLKNRYKITAFRFRSNLPGLTPETRIKLECTVLVCVIGENTRCAEKCISSAGNNVATPSRKRRSIDGEESMMIEHENRVLETPEHRVKSDARFSVFGTNGRGRSLDVSDLTVYDINPNNNKDLITVIVVLGAMLFITFGVIGVVIARNRRRRNVNVATVDGGEEIRHMVAS